MLFLGHSGSGKTTLARLLADHFTILRDDRVFIQMQKDRSFLAKGTKESSDTHEVHSIIRIFGAEQAEISPMSQAKTCEYLMDAVFEIDFQQKSRNIKHEQQWFIQCAHLARHCPGWLLHFSLDPGDVIHQLQKTDTSDTFSIN